MIFDRADYIAQPVPIEAELKKLFKKGSLITIFEIGGCEGEDAIRYSNLFPNSKIYTFEPLPENANRIKNNISAYGKGNIVLLPYALSDKNETAEFHVSSGTPQGQENNESWDFGNKSSSLLAPDKHIDLVEFISFKNIITVRTRTLAAFCECHGIKSIDFIHMDVQGAEMMVLSGAGKMIAEVKAIWLEVSKVSLYKNQPLANDIEKFMSENNFVLIKDTVDDITGDRFYVSSSYFPNHVKLFHKKNSKKHMSFYAFLKRVVKKAYSIFR